jgi:hypothetical protein
MQIEGWREDSYLEPSGRSGNLKMAEPKDRRNLDQLPK